MKSSAVSNCVVRAVIKFLNAQGDSGSKIHHRLSNVYGAPRPKPKMWFTGRHLTIEENLRSAVAEFEFFAKRDAEWYSAGTHKLILRYNNCMDEQGDYV